MVVPEVHSQRRVEPSAPLWSRPGKKTGHAVEPFDDGPQIVGGGCRPLPRQFGEPRLRGRACGFRFADPRGHAHPWTSPTSRRLDDGVRFLSSSNDEAF